jgi:MauM/NapG family ferredoxin protein
MDRRSFLKNVAGISAASAAAVCVTGAFQGTADAEAAPIRPPGALPENDFVSTCIRCMRCVDACPNQCIKSMASSAGGTIAGTPYIKPREQACMLCSRAAGDYLRCTEVCPSGALQPILKNVDAIRGKVRMGVAKIDFNLCYSYNNYTCGTCVYACPLQGTAIRAGLWERPVVSEAACIGCGLCERACIRYPQAIRVEPIERHGAEADEVREEAAP